MKAVAQAWQQPKVAAYLLQRRGAGAEICQQSKAAALQRRTRPHRRRWSAWRALAKQHAASTTPLRCNCTLDQNPLQTRLVSLSPFCYPFCTEAKVAEEIRPQHIEHARQHLAQA